MNKNQYKSQEVIWVSIGDVKSKSYTVSEDSVNLIASFTDWLMAQRILPFKTLVIGGGRYQGLFNVEDWPVVKRWLDENKIRHFIGE